MKEQRRGVKRVRMGKERERGERERGKEGEKVDGRRGKIFAPLDKSLDTALALTRFCCRAPSVWNAALSTTSVKLLYTFKHHLKTQLSRQP